MCRARHWSPLAYRWTYRSAYSRLAKSSIHAEARLAVRLGVRSCEREKHRRRRGARLTASPRASDTISSSSGSEGIRRAQQAWRYADRYAEARGSPLVATSSPRVEISTRSRTQRTARGGCTLRRACRADRGNMDDDAALGTRGSPSGTTGSRSRSCSTWEILTRYGYRVPTGSTSSI